MSNYLHRPGRTTNFGVWYCPGCGNEQGGDPALGCTSCGNGSAQQAAAAQVQPTLTIDPERLHSAIVAPPYHGHPELGQPAQRLFQLTEQALWTVATALAHYADHGQPTTAELPRVLIKAWAEQLSSYLLDQEAEKERALRAAATPPTTEGDPL